MKEKLEQLEQDYNQAMQALEIAQANVHRVAGAIAFVRGELAEDDAPEPEEPKEKKK